MPYGSMPGFREKKRGKINHERVAVSGIVFDSVVEADRYRILWGIEVL